MNLVKIVAALTAMVMVTSFVLMVIGVIAHLWFWIVVALCAFVAWYVLPRMHQQ